MIWQDKATEDYLEYQMLHAQLRYYKFMYYLKAASPLADADYDIMEKRFNALAIDYGLPGTWVGCRDRPEEE